MPIRPVAMVLALGALAVACSVSNARTGIQADPWTVERAGEHVFEAYRIPVAERVQDGRVRSSAFIANEVWNPGTVAYRVDCGTDEEGRERVTRAPVRLSVTLDISEWREGVDIYVRSTGSTVARGADPVRAKCRLSDAFGAELVDAVARSFPGSGLPDRAIIAGRPFD